MIARVILYGYVLIYLAASALAIIGTQGYFGVTPDGLAAVYLIVVGLPWSLIVSLPFSFSDWSLLIAQIAVFLAPLINIWLLWRFSRR